MPHFRAGLYDWARIHSYLEAALAENVEDIAGSAPRQGFGSEIFWRLLATVILISVVWILWLLWQITPKSAVNPIVFQIQQNRQSSGGTIQRAPAGERTADSPGTQSVAPPSALSTGAPLENLKIETELKVPPVPGAAAKQ